MKQLTFKDVCNKLKKDKSFNGICDDLNALSGATILLLGARGASGDISAFLDALTIKDQLIDIGKNVLDKIINKKTNECDKRINQMQWAYSVIYYTAFFDVLDEQMPKEMRKAIDLSLKEKKAIFESIDCEKSGRDHSLSDTEIFFPNIVYGYADIEKHLGTMYGLMRDGLIKFVHMLSFEETSSEKTISHFLDIVNKMPQLAIERFRGQYLYLASHYNEFYVYMQMENNKREMGHIEELYQNIICMGCNTDNKIDVGLKHLEKILLDLPEKMKEDKVNDIINNLMEKYQGDIEKPIIDSNNSDEKLNYPSIGSAFIPQSYKILEYSGREKLEKKDTWKDLDECSDMDSFWAKFYVSHYSLDNLLLILGEPGGGKSLLTKIVCARMSDRNNIFVRIPLREVSVEKEIEDIVCEQIQRDGDAAEQLPTYKWFAENFKYNPITLVFDGYDEVLQATGGVYRNFLKKILKFQEQCAERHRPVRVVVTSRETLIDKADIPVGTIALKLLEFNEHQRKQWIEIWNEKNKDVYREEQIASFMLPKDNSSIDELSRQPLLLLMLAIYDANLEEGTNSLGQEENLNRTKLYNELLRRFIRRELRKGPRGNEVSYEESEKKDKELMVDSEMEKLGIAALGMFIRGKLSLKVNEMERDLRYMESRMPTYDKVGKMLSDAEEFFGSFFFIHDSQSGNIETEDKEVAFEFLHKTFYEFLVADLVLKYLIRAIDELDAMKTSKRRDSYQKAIDDPNHFDKQFYTALMSAYLCAEPEIIEMIVEWKENVINECFQGERDDYDIILEELFDRQIEMLCKDIFMPSIWNEQTYDSVSKRSYMQNCATYFMNLLILQATTKRDSKRIIRSDDWRYISQFWKMNIQEDVLLKFTSLFSVADEEERVCIKKKQVFDQVEQKDMLERQKDILNFLQDDISYDIYCLHDEEVPYGKKQKYRKSLLKRGVIIRFEMLLGEINEFILTDNNKFSLKKNIGDVIQVLSYTKADASDVLDWLLCVNKCLEKMPNPFLGDKGGVDQLVEEVLYRYPENIQIIAEVFKCWKTIGDVGALANRRLFMQIFKKAEHENPYLLIECLDFLDSFLLIKEGIKLSHDLTVLLHKAHFSSWTLKSRVLKFYYKINAKKDAEYLLQDIVRNINEIYEHSPEVVIDILQLCVMHDRMEEADRIVMNGVNRFKELFYKQPELVVDFLEVAIMSRQTQKYVREMLYDIDYKYEMLIYRNPKNAVRMFKIILLYGDQYKNQQTIRKFYRQFDLLLSADSKEAITFLKLTYKYDQEKYVSKALNYSLQRMNYLLDKSVDSAVDLLILCKEIECNRCYYIKICLDYILYNQSMVDTKKIYELLDSLMDNEINEMADFLKERYLYIIINFPGWAEKIAELYSDTIWKTEFIDILSDYKYNYI